MPMIINQSIPSLDNRQMTSLLLRDWLSVSYAHSLLHSDHSRRAELLCTTARLLDHNMASACSRRHPTAWWHYSSESAATSHDCCVSAQWGLLTAAASLEARLCPVRGSAFGADKPPRLLHQAAVLPTCMMRCTIMLHHPPVPCHTHAGRPRTAASQTSSFTCIDVGHR